MKTIITFGTFDVFHPGHASYLAQAKALGEKLVVVVARDKTVQAVKGALPRNSEEVRLKGVEESELADEVILGNLENKYLVLKEVRPDIVALGYDQKVDLNELQEKIQELELDSKIVKLKSYQPEIYKSSKL